jgi:uncharacterized membrane protein YozB (DUF420 family)
LTTVSPFISLYAISFIKKGDNKKHIQIQRRLFFACIIALLVLESMIRFSGGSGSLVANSPYLDTPFFKLILPAHIIGAVLTYILWAIMIIRSNQKYKQAHLPGSFSASHKTLGKITTIGLFYTAFTALIVYLLTFIL